MHGIQKYIIGMVDSWSPEEPSSRQPLKPIMSWSSFPTILVKSSIEILASGHRLLNLQEIIDLPSERASLLSLSLSLSLSRVCPTQEETYHLKMWKLSMKESDWNNNNEVVLDMKSDARHFREERGFEVPPPPSLSSSVQLELAISLSSCNLSSPDGPSSVASQTPTTQNVCHPCCGSRVCSVQSFDLLACKMQSVFPLTCVISRSLSPC